MNDRTKTKSETEETAKNETTEVDTAVPDAEISDQELQGVAGGISGTINNLTQAERAATALHGAGSTGSSSP